MRRFDSFEGTPMLGKIEGRRRRERWREWDGWMAPPTQWTWVWMDSGSWWWTGRRGVLWFMWLQRVGLNWVTELNNTQFQVFFFSFSFFLMLKTFETYFLYSTLEICNSVLLTIVSMLYTTFQSQLLYSWQVIPFDPLHPFASPLLASTSHFLYLWAFFVYLFILLDSAYKWEPYSISL